jgi:hypothetical protein
VTIEKENAMYVFGDKGERLPARAVKGFDALEKLFYHPSNNNSSL